jgi:glycosidase
VTNLYGDGACGGDGNLKPSDLPPGWGEPNQRLALAFAFLFTTEGQPLVYYGDEIGLPGFADPDNRQPMRFESLSDDESRVRQTVARLAGARAEHPAFYRGTRVEWWDNEPDLWAYARVDGDDAMLAILNRADSSRVVQNGVDWAGLPRGTYVDVLDGSEWSTMDDILAVEVPALAARVLVPR